MPPGLIIINQAGYRLANIVSVIPLCGGSGAYKALRRLEPYATEIGGEISAILNETSSAAEKSILPVARLIPRHADAIYRVNLNVRGTQLGQNHSGNVISIE